MSVPSSQASAVSTSDLSGPVCELCGNASRTPTGEGSLLSTGLEFRAIATCEPLWPTPVGSVAQLGESPETWLPRREEVKERVRNGNGMGLPLTIVVQLDPMDWHMEGKCPCRCHTSMSSVAVSPAKTFLLPARAQGLEGRVRVFGPSSPDSLASFDRGTLLWRTSQLSLLEEWAEFSGTWPRAGMTRSGTVFPLRPLAPLTGGIAFGSWPTPHGFPKDGQARNPGPSGNELGRAVNAAERQWPTPKASPSGPDYARANREGSGGDDLATAVAREGTGALNPTWVEWLMGFPPGWTALPPSETH